MSTRTGFPRMDWDTGFLADPKFQHLRDLLPDPIQFGYAAFSYLRLASDAWRTCERHPIQEIVRGIEPWAVAGLLNAGLLDEGSTIPAASFEKWVGSAIDARFVWKERQKKSRESRRPDASHAESRDVTESHRESPPARANGRETTVGPEGQVGTDEGVQGEDAVFTFLAQHGAFIREDAPLGRRLLMLIERRGAEMVMAEAVTMAEVAPVMSDRQWVLGLENAIERIPSGKPSAEAFAAEADARSESRSAQIQRKMWERRMEEYRATETWRPEWGPKPETVQ